MTLIEALATGPVGPVTTPASVPVFTDSVGLALMTLQPVLSVTNMTISPIERNTAGLGFGVARHGPLGTAAARVTDVTNPPSAKSYIHP